MFLIDDLLLAPVSGFKFILGQIQKMADQELNDDTVIKEQLLELQMRKELDEISDKEFEERERELFARLRAIKMRQLDLMLQVAHTKDSSSIVIEVGGDSHVGFHERHESGRTHVSFFLAAKAGSERPPLPQQPHSSFSIPQNDTIPSSFFQLIPHFRYPTVSM